MWIAGVRSTGTRIQSCASEGCGRVATWRLESGGVGSEYCGECKRKIELQISRKGVCLECGGGSFALNEASVCPTCVDETQS